MTPRRVNLMPWRDKRRKERQKAFLTMLGLSAAGAAAAVMLVWVLQAGLVESQESRNRKIEKETKDLVKKAEQIQDLDIKRERLLGRKKVIEELQSSRSQMVHLFDQLVRTVPDGIQLRAIQQTGGFLVLEGQAESNSRVSDYLRRLDESDWLEKPDLQYIEAEDSPGSKVKAPKGSGGVEDGLPFLFKIQVSLVNPTQPSEDGEAPRKPATVSAEVNAPTAQAEPPVTTIQPEAPPSSVPPADKQPASTEPPVPTITPKQDSTDPAVPPSQES